MTMGAASVRLPMEPLPCAAGTCQPGGGLQVCHAAGRCPRVLGKLRAAGIAPTSQRCALGAMLFCVPVHVTAEQLMGAARQQALTVSRATVYNTLRRFTDAGLLRELPIEGLDTVYDSTTQPHHHFHDVVTGEVIDIDAETLRISGLDALPAAWDIDGVEIVVRGRRRVVPA